MDYIPTLTLNFPGGATNAYRLHESHIEFQTGEGKWRILDSNDVELHFLLHTEVAKWVLQHINEMNPHVRATQATEKRKPVQTEEVAAGTKSSKAIHKYIPCPACGGSGMSNSGCACLACKSTGEVEVKSK